MISRILLIAVLLVQMIAPALPGAQASPAAAAACCCEGEACPCEGCGCAENNDPQPTSPTPASHPGSVRDLSWVPVETDELILPPIDAAPMAGGFPPCTGGNRRLPNEVSLTRLCVRLT